MGKPQWVLDIEQQEDERFIQSSEEAMEKYGVQIDPDKKPDPKKPGEKTAGADDPNVNVPKDKDKGTEPFEKKPAGDK